MESQQHHSPHLNQSAHQHQQQQQQHQRATRVVSHWAKSTPEEGIQLIFNKADTNKDSAGSRILTSPTSIERPCQWDICLRLVSSSLYPLAADAPTIGIATASLPGARSNSTAPTLPYQTLSQQQHETTTSLPSTMCRRSATPLLVLTLQRASIWLSSAGHGHGGDGNGLGGVGVGVGGSMGLVDPINPGRARCDSYRTIYIYSPRLRRDIRVQPINQDLWPQSVVFKCEDVTDEDHNYHFQLWLSGASPRQTDAETDTRTTQQKNLLFAMRQDTATCNVQICIRDPPPPITVPQACLETASSSLFGKRAASHGTFGSGGYHHHGHSGGQYYNTLLTTSSSAPTGATYESKHDGNHNTHTSKIHDSNNDSYSKEPIRGIFWAHKTILESVPFFSRMLSRGRFKEGQPSPDGIFRINLSSDMFEPKVMDTLLDYIYTREPIQNDESMGDDDVDNTSTGNGGYYNINDNNIGNYNNSTCYIEDCESWAGPPTMNRRHHVSANVALNLQSVVSEPSLPRSHHPQSHSCSQAHPRTPAIATTGRSSSWPFSSATTTTGFSHEIESALTSSPPPTPHHIHPYTSRYTHSLRTCLKPEDWFLLYRAAVHMEDPPLQAQALDQIQAQLNVQSALERALTWGPGYPEIKKVVLKYVFDERRAIFGDEEHNQLRPYLWPEIEDQVDVLVEITSKIARQ